MFQLVPELLNGVVAVLAGDSVVNDRAEPIVNLIGRHCLCDVLDHMESFLLQLDVVVA